MNRQRETEQGHTQLQIDTKRHTDTKRNKHTCSDENRHKETQQQTLRDTETDTRESDIRTDRKGHTRRAAKTTPKVSQKRSHEETDRE